MASSALNFRGKLQEYVQRKRMKNPVFDTSVTVDRSSAVGGTTSPLQVFTCTVTIEDVPFVALGSSIRKKEAESQAALNMLLHLAKNDPTLSGITMPESWKSMLEESNRSLSGTPERIRTSQSASSVPSTPVRSTSAVDDSQEVPVCSNSIDDLQEVNVNGIKIFMNDPLDPLKRVFRGTFEGMEVAVKRVQKEVEKYFLREVEALRKLNHRYIVRYLSSGSAYSYLYIAVELCAGTLEDYLAGTIKLGSKLSKKEILHQVVKGMDYIHSARIVHRDVKPTNILISKPDFRNGVYAKIADFGLSKNVKGELGDFSLSTLGPVGTIDWIAPEWFKENPEGVTWKVDVFSLGSVFYYTLSGRTKPFSYDWIGGKWEVKKVHSVDDLLDVEEEGKALIEAMISSDPEERPHMSAILRHPFFWSPKKKIEFLSEVSDCLYDKHKRSDPDPVSDKLENRFAETIGEDWLDRLQDDCEVLWQEFVKPQRNNTLRRYMDGGTIRDLLRAIRNTKHHLREKSQELIEAVGTKPEEYYSFWNSRFPKLLLHTWEAFEENKDEEGFEDYYCNTFTFSRQN